MSNQNTISIKQERQSNIELLRIIAMFLVLVVHCDYRTFGAPSLELIHSNTLSSFLKILVENISIICVDVFILISGWFGIHPKIKSAGNFIFQCLFFSFGVYLIFVFCGLENFNLRRIGVCLYFGKRGWFVKAYLCLYILSPVLNAFVEKASQKQFGITILLFYVFSSLYGWSNSAQDFLEGYSTISFIGLYLLARYVRLYPMKFFKLKKSKDFLLYFILTLLFPISIMLLARMGFDGIIVYLMNFNVYYISPFVIFASLFLLLCFSKMRIRSRVINWIATSCFAVYLLHGNPSIFESYFMPFVKNLNDTYNAPIFFVTLFLFLICVFVFSILVDKIRIYIWNHIWNFYELHKIK
jgi:surface polysaccharide O-acyltransferase-like enzyme